MSLETAIRSILATTPQAWTNAGNAAAAAAATAFLAAVGARVVPLTAAGRTRPFVAYEITSAEDPAPSHDGPSGFTRGEFDLVIVTDTYAEAIAISGYTRTLMEAFKGTAGGTSVRWLTFKDQSDIEQALDPGDTKPPYVRTQTIAALVKDAA